jgi:pimeloyl-ACP methyl ester carboxylesterase
MTTPHLEPIVSGNATGETILFVQGWPDDASLWDETVALLAPRYRCVRTNMPNYDGTVTAPRGYHTEEMVSAIADLIERVATNGPITLVLHDWGSYWGHPAHHRVPNAVARVASVDVAPHFQPETATQIAGILAYQSYLLTAFAIGGSIGDAMTRAAAKRFGAPLEPSRIRAAMNYPYRNVFEDLVSGRGRRLTKGYWPTCPLLFVYGEKKPFPFHSQRWIDHVKKVEGGEVVSLPSNHWVPKHPQFAPLLARWLERTEQAARVAGEA